MTITKQQTDQWAADIDYWSKKYADLGLQYDLLQQRIKELEADAGRYRWLREQEDGDEIFCMYGKNGRFGECGHCDIGGDLLDREIDRAMSESALQKMVDISQEYKLP